MVRIKHRYLLFNILYPSPSVSSSTSTTPNEPTPSPILFSRPSPAHLTPSALLTHIRTSISSLFGDHGTGVTSSSLRIIYFSPATSTCILRVPRAHFRLVWASLTFVGAIPGAGARRGDDPGERQTPCVIRVVRVSGTIRKSEEELLRRARAEIVRAKREGTSPGTEQGERVLEGLFGEKRTGKDNRRGTAQGAGLLVGGEEEVGIEDLDDDDEDDMEDLSD